MQKVLLFGCGEFAVYALKHMNLNPESVIGFVETKKSASTYKGILEKFNGKPIYSIDEVKNLDFDKIFITNQYFVTLEQCLQIGIPEEKIYIMFQNVYEEYKSKYPHGKVKYHLVSVLTPKNYMYKFLDEKLLEVDGNYISTADDYVRVGTMQMLIEEIKNHNVSGEIAELGVYRGDFSKYLNELFPDRTLNLFDTFEGFPDQDVDLNLDNNYSLTNRVTAKDVLSNTSIDLVMSKMKYPDNIKIYQGYFPDTIPAEEKTFAFVSLDADLYKPIYEGLKYFYPRLSVGGYIMIHDYNCDTYSKGVHQAVKDFENINGRINKVPIPDKCGSLIITK